MSVNINADDSIESLPTTPFRKVRSQTFSLSGLPKTTRAVERQSDGVETTLGDSVENLLDRL